MLLNDGIYANCKAMGASPYYRKSGNLSVAVKVVTDAGVEILARLHVELNDGSISDKTLKTLREVFPAYDGTVEGLFIEDNFVDVPCSITVENTTGDDGKTWSSVKWLNAPGGGSAALPDKADKSELAAKYGAKFRALAGPVAPKESAPPPAKAAKAPPAKKTPPAKAVGMDECWQKCQDEFGDKAAEKWTALIEKLAGGKDYPAITAKEWAAVMKAMEDNLQF